MGGAAAGRAQGDDRRPFAPRVVAELETLAATLTAEVGKPLAQSRNELNGFLGRIDFFLAEVERAVADEEVFADAGMRERIGQQPLGVVANVSAWNYPYFVGGNVFVPALLTGNAVLYKPSEFATLTGLHIDRLLHAARRAGRRVHHPRRRRRGRRGADRAEGRRRVLHRLGAPPGRASPRRSARA